MGQNIRANAQALRKNATKQENRLWYDFLRGYPIQFRRQVPFGRYIVDFYCAQAKIAVELDGSQHFNDADLAYDRERTIYLNERFGVRVLRFTNLDVDQNFAGVCAAIQMEVEKAFPTQGARWRGEAVTDEGE